jgi:hypothetical protein
MEELREALGLPNIGGQIIAYTDSFYNKEIEKLDNKIVWRIDIIIPGPDNRYKAGKVSFDSTDWLISSFENAYQKMRVLENQSFSGEYSNTIADCIEEDWPSERMTGAMVDVKASNGQIQMLFWVTSGTFRFSRCLTLTDVNNGINLLKAAKQKAENMVEALKELTKD